MSVTLVLPGDEVAAPWLAVDANVTANRGKKHAKTVGVGLEVSEERTLVAKVAGILRETDHKVWIESSETRDKALLECKGGTCRYIPKSGDYVLGTVTTQLTDYYRVDVGGPQQAMLSYLSFEGATKRNRPQVKPGSLVYGQVQLASKNVEPELSCIDADGRAQGMGVIKTAGNVVQVPLNLARRLLQPDNKLLTALGKELKFELVVGMNGQILITGAPRTVVAVQKILSRSLITFEANYEKMIAEVLSYTMSVPADRI